MDHEEAPWLLLLGERQVYDGHGVTMKIVALECGHEQIGGLPYIRRRCVECFDKAKYDKPAPTEGG